jgi:N-methylhydantoinase A/oxoprolinase/acetone carboxylase beta subunit
MGSQLSTQLNSVKRATTAALNASLVSVMQDFIEAVRRSLQVQGIDATLMVVKGDGSLMPYTDAIRRPVETIVSGPAASAIGGYYLCGRPSGLMIDVGGTTTDMALIEQSAVDVADQGARVGDVETAVKTARIRTACVGCDSWVHFERDGRGLIVGPERVVPLCRLADQFPLIAEEISRLHRIADNQRQWTDVEYWVLRRRPTSRRREHLTEKQKALVEVLSENGPMNLTRLMRELNVHHPVQLQAAPLFRQGHIEKGGLTPTDLLHVQGRMDKWNADAARQGLAHAAFLFDMSEEEVETKAFEFIAANIAEEVIVFLAGRDAERLPEQIDGTWGRWFFEEFIADKNPLLSVNLTSHFPTVGLGAPAEVFIEAVAEKLGSELIIPRNHEVANAIGAVAGSIMIERQALLFVQESEDKRSYQVHVAGQQKQFDKEENARKYARSRVTELALEGADAAGAFEPELSVSVETEGSVERYIAQAVGNPDLSESFSGNHDSETDEETRREPEPAE